jgi:hypothetical protein
VENERGTKWQTGANSYDYVFRQAEAEPFNKTTAL